MDNSNISGKVSFGGFVSSWMFQDFLLEPHCAAGVVWGVERRKMSTLAIFLSHFLTHWRVSEHCGSWVFKSNQKSIKLNPVLNFPFSKSDKKAKVNFAQRA